MHWWPSSSCFDIWDDIDWSFAQKLLKRRFLHRLFRLGGGRRGCTLVSHGIHPPLEDGSLVLQILLLQLAGFLLHGFGSLAFVIPGFHPAVVGFHQVGLVVGPDLSHTTPAFGLSLQVASPALSGSFRERRVCLLEKFFGLFGGVSYGRKLLGYRRDGFVGFGKGTQAGQFLFPLPPGLLASPVFLQSGSSGSLTGLEAFDRDRLLEFDPLLVLQERTVRFGFAGGVFGAW